MKTTLTLIAATIVPGGYVVLALVGLGGFLIARWRRTQQLDAKPVLSGPLIP